MCVRSYMYISTTRVSIDIVLYRVSSRNALSYENYASKYIHCPNGTVCISHGPLLGGRGTEVTWVVTYMYMSMQSLEVCLCVVLQY